VILSESTTVLWPVVVEAMPLSADLRPGTAQNRGLAAASSVKSNKLGLARQDGIGLANGSPRAGPWATERRPAGSGLHGSTLRYNGSVGRVGPVGHHRARSGHPSQIRFDGQQTSSSERRGRLAEGNHLPVTRPSQTGHHSLGWQLASGWTMGHQVHAAAAAVPAGPAR
jgi:hypothetical protein